MGWLMGNGWPVGAGVAIGLLGDTVLESLLWFVLVSSFAFITDVVFPAVRGRANA